MKGNALPFVLIFTVVIIGMVSLYFYSAISDVDDTIEVIEHENFVKSLDQSINEYAFSKKRGSYQTFSFNTPAETVCFVDKENEIQKFSNPEIDLQIENQDDKNLFFVPSNYPSAELEHFKLEKNPLCVESKNGKIDLTLESKGNYTFITAENVVESECTTLTYNKEDNLDIVFVGLNYDNENELINEAYNYISNVMGKVSPFSEHTDKINYYMIEENAPCNVLTTASYIKCDNFKLNKIASKCPNDFIVVLTDGKIFDFFVRSSSIGNIVKVNTIDDDLVFVHELAHGFANLADEYVADEYYSQFGINADDFPNCDTKGCESWEADPGCFKGCSLSYFYRPTENSIMKNYRTESGKEFGPINEEIITKRLEVYK